MVKDEKQESTKIVSCRNVHKWYGNFEALKGVDLDVATGEVIVIIGPSGSGKSTLIRCLNHLEEHEEGTIIVDGIELTHDIRNIQEIRSEIGIVFQSFNLFPHMTVMENLTLAPINVRHWTREESERIAESWLRRVGIFDQAAKYPGQLSGGQQQRVAIARALTMQPKILLFDEPTSALDPEMIKEVLDVMKDLATAGYTILAVTHEMSFAREVADRIIFIEKGQIVEQNSPDQFFTNPQHARTRHFLSQIL